MNIDDSPETLARKRNQLELWVASLAFLSQFLIKGVNRYFFDQYVPANELAAWLILIFGGGIAPCFIWYRYIQKKLQSYLDQSYKDDLIGEIRALKTLKNSTAWALFQSKRRWSLAIQFCFSSSLGGFFTTFFF